VVFENALDLRCRRQHDPALDRIGW